MQVPKRKPGKFTSMAKDPHMTQDRFDALEAEMKKLKAQHPKALEDMHHFAEMGDFSENAGYQNAKRRVRRILYRMAEIESELKRAVIIEKPSTDCVSLGHSVTVRINGKAEAMFQILGSTETDPSSGVISQHSPVGKALIGKSVGDIVSVDLGDREVSYEVLAIE